MKKIFSFVLSAIIFLNIIPITVSAAEYTGKCGDNLTWSYDEETSTLTISGTGDMYDYGYDYDYKPWPNIIEKVIISEGVTSIGAYAFTEYEYLLSAEIADSVKKIGYHSFWGCYQLTTLTIGNGVEIIDEAAFADCDSLLTLEIPDSVKNIGCRAFSGCRNLTDVAIGKGVSEIDVSAFDSCPKLERIVVDEDNEYYSSDEHGVLYNKSKTNLIEYPVGSPITEYVIPDGVEKISGMYLSLYEKINLAKLTIPGSVTTIGKRTFDDYTNLTTVIIGEGVKTIGTSAFEWCKNLEEIIIPDSVTTVGKKAFYGCSNLEKIVIGKSVETIGESAFVTGSKLSDVYYTGSKEQWESISIGRYNNTLLNAKIHFDCQKVVTPPTCTEEGYVTYTCSCCDVGCVFDSIEPTAHNYVGEETPATCTKHGVTNYTCESCGDSYFKYTANPTGHTLNEDGICEACGEKETITTPVNTQMLTIESVLAMVMNLLAKIFGVFSVA